MFKNYKVLAIVPARGGSKGIPLKNLKKVNGLSLIGHVGNLVKQVDEIDKTILSSDNELIINESKKYGIEAPFIRPKYLSGDKIGDIDVLKHALNKIEKLEKIEYDIIVMLQPTSPLRTAKIVKNSIKELINKRLDSVWTISKTDLKFHPLKQLKLDSNNNLDYFNKLGSNIVARQELTTLYHRNGAAYSMTRSCLMEQNTLMGKNAGSILLDVPMISIDTLEDLKLAEKIISKNKYVKS